MFEIGNSLREARLRHGIDFPEAELSTKIRGKYLRALEEEQFELLPAQTYVKGFLRTYAEYLGLDGQLYLDEYNSRFVSGEEETPLRARRSTPPRRDRHRRLESRVIVLTLLGIAAVTALVIVAWNSGGTSGENAIPNLSRSHGTPPASSVTRKAPTARIYVKATRGNSVLEVHESSPTGDLVWHGTLERGDTLRLVRPRFWLEITNPENVLLKLNGRRVPLPATGAPTHLIVTPKRVAGA